MGDAPGTVRATVQDERSSWTDSLSDMKIDIISRDAIEYYVRAGKASKRLLPYFDGDTKHVLEWLCVSDTNDLVAVSAVLLFGKDINRSATGSFVKIGEFSDDGKLLREDIVDIPVAMQPDAVMKILFEEYIQRQNGTGKGITYEYPMAAVREVLMNAIVHKDYGTFEPVVIKIYPDRMSISNPGTLPKGWRIGKLRKDHTSVVRNKNIADVFYDMGYIDRWGIGIRNLTDSCRKNGNPEPKFSAGRNGIEVTFYPIR